MKKLFTMVAVGVVTFTINTASAGNLHATKVASTKKVVIPAINNTSTLRSSGCDTLLNISNSDNSVSVYSWQSPAVGYVAGSGALSDGTNFYTIQALAEEFSAPGLYNPYVTSAIVPFGYAVINPSDSALTVTAYVYNTAGTGGAPGAALDSASVTLRSIAYAITDTGLSVFSFTHQPTIAGGAYFIVINLPQMTGDTLAAYTSGGATGAGLGWLDLAGQWVPYRQLLASDTLIDDYIIATVCGTACPTITVGVTQNDRSATASASGGVGTYTYSWSDGQTGATASSLTSNTYTVTATDANGCTGTGTVTINTTGINSIGGLSNFSVFPNPSNGVFTTTLNLESASDVTISVVDMTGSKVYETTDNAVKTLSKQMDLSSIAPGIYIMNVKTANGSVNQRLVIK
jgi:hypothetical protein